ncbi:MAG TPA: hypothetical protein VI875_05325 [Candidatus Norongarragalinales archaeon]|nr:hypothetical protein [Candidatus Norongarragalinales archaeon]
MPGDETAREAYLRGRLEGLNELLAVLKEAISQGGNEALEKSLVEHVSSELEGMISELKGVVPQGKMLEFEQKHEELKQAAEEQPLGKAHVKKADELMQSLLEMQKG